MEVDVRQRWVTVGKEFDFHAAHQLPNHDGQCQRVHGHTYKLVVEVRGLPQETTGESDEGMVIDFGRIKWAYKNLIEPIFEHHDLNLTVRPLLYQAGLPEVTSCEVMVQFIAQRLSAHWADEDRFRLTRVRLYETPTSYAEVAW